MARDVKTWVSGETKVGIMASEAAGKVSEISPASIWKMAYFYQVVSIWNQS